MMSIKRKIDDGQVFERAFFLDLIFGLCLTQGGITMCSSSMALFQDQGQSWGKRENLSMLLRRDKQGTKDGAVNKKYLLPLMTSVVTSSGTHSGLRLYYSYSTVNLC